MAGLFDPFALSMMPIAGLTNGGARCCSIACDPATAQGFRSVNRTWYHKR